MIREKRKVSLLDNIIKLLIILLLLGALVLLALFTLNTLKEQDTSVAKTAVTKKINLKKTKHESISATNNTTEKKIYSQEEMQEIVQMMMDQMQELNAQTKTSSTKLSINNEEENIDNLIQSLEEVQEDEIKEFNNTSDKLDDTRASNNTQIKDHYNKVIIDKSQYSDESLDSLSKKIGNIINDISTKKNNKSKTYTQKISKELDTRVDEMRVIIVKKGDTLSKIAVRAYGKVSAYHKLLEANKDLIKNPNHIYIGQRLRVPTL